VSLSETRGLSGNQPKAQPLTLDACTQLSLVNRPKTHNPQNRLLPAHPGAPRTRFGFAETSHSLAQRLTALEPYVRTQGIARFARELAIRPLWLFRGPCSLAQRLPVSFAQRLTPLEPVSLARRLTASEPCVRTVGNRSLRSRMGSRTLFDVRTPKRCRGSRVVGRDPWWLGSGRGGAVGVRRPWRRSARVASISNQPSSWRFSMWRSRLLTELPLVLSLLALYLIAIVL
jgi:hypothetical protein